MNVLYQSDTNSQRVLLTHTKKNAAVENAAINVWAQ